MFPVISNKKIDSGKLILGLVSESILHTRHLKMVKKKKKKKNVHCGKLKYNSRSIFFSRLMLKLYDSHFSNEHTRQEESRDHCRFKGNFYPQYLNF